MATPVSFGTIVILWFLVLVSNWAILVCQAWQEVGPASANAEGASRWSSAFSGENDLGDVSALKLISKIL